MHSEPFVPWLRRIRWRRAMSASGEPAREDGEHLTRTAPIPGAGHDGGAQSSRRASYYWRILASAQAFVTAHRSISQEIFSLETRLAVLESPPEVVVNEHREAEEIIQLVKRLEQRIARLEGEVNFAHRRLADVADAGPPVRPLLANNPASHAHQEVVGRFLAGFAEHFRGPREEIKKRLQVHLTRVSAAGSIAVDRPLLDIGCGRGEWLEVLADAGLTARGIEADAQLVDLCNSRGLAAQQAEALEHLGGLSDESLGAVSAFHIIEHLEPVRMLALIDEARRCLVSGGLFLLETPNPENFWVSACTFYNDLTHAKPIPPDLAHFLVASRGFTDIELLRLNPYPAEFRIRETTETAKRLNDILYGPQDLAIIARKA